MISAYELGVCHLGLLGTFAAVFAVYSHDSHTVMRTSYAMNHPKSLMKCLSDFSSTLQPISPRSTCGDCYFSNIALIKVSLKLFHLH